MLERFNSLAMSEGCKMYRNWEIYVVHQRDEKDGCVPTGYEILLKAKEIEFDDDKFQENVNCVLIRNELNDFNNVANEIKKQYPDFENKHKISFEWKPFSEGEKKLKTIKELFDEDILTLVSLPNFKHSPLYYPNEEGIEILKPVVKDSQIIEGCHIMPVIGVHKDYLLLFHYMNKEGIKTLTCVHNNDLVWIHDNTEGFANDIAYLRQSNL